MEAWYAKSKNPTGKRSLVFTAKNALQPDAPIEIACGQCIGCRLERSRQWAVRCMHEASLHEDNCFLTLTFNNESLAARPNPESLDVTEWQKFMKRLRKKYGSNIRFFHCGEYGELNQRPHYHAILFGFDFPDKELFSISNGNKLYISDSLSKLWPFGYATIGNCTFESCAYVARYIMKKVTGDQSFEHYLQEIDEETGEFTSRKPEYITMSRRPGIGKDWINTHIDDVYPRDYIIVNGKKCRPPKFYDKVLEELKPYDHDFLKYDREQAALGHLDDNTRERLDVREKVKKAQITRLKRDL